MDLPRNSGVPRATPEPGNVALSSKNRLIMKNDNFLPTNYSDQEGQRSRFRQKQKRNLEKLLALVGKWLARERGIQHWAWQLAPGPAAGTATARRGANARRRAGSTSRLQGWVRGVSRLITHHFLLPGSREGLDPLE